MNLEIITDNDQQLIRRMVLQPGEPMFWHVDTCERFTVVIQGSRLAIEYKDAGERHTFEVHPGMVGWDQPDDKVHRAINAGTDIYEEVVTFYKTSPDHDPQPKY